MTSYPRGIAPEILLSQVRSTMPYLFEESLAPEDLCLTEFPPAQVLRKFAETPTVPLNHAQYFELCLSAHYLTCGTPVPTDVDNQIRQKLWPAGLPLETALEMANTVLQSQKWNFVCITGRYLGEKKPLSGHLGEWFTVAAGAYCALERYRSAAANEMQQALLSAIHDETEHHSEFFGALWRGGDGLGALKASAHIAHNFGDLDRVIDMWDLPPYDPLRMNFYKLASLPFDSGRKLRHQGRLWVAGELYKSPMDGSSMALENHRHFALRKARCLRSKRSLLIPTGPFFDAWGQHTASTLPGEEIREVVAALEQGWSRLPQTHGYERALIGIRSVFPKLDLERKLSSLSQEHFEKLWSEAALKWMDEIPSRAE